MQNYLLLARSNTGSIEEKVNVFCELEKAKEVLGLIMSSRKNLVRGEILEGNRAWIMDFRVKPVWSVGYDT